MIEAAGDDDGPCHVRTLPPSLEAPIQPDVAAKFRAGCESIMARASYWLQSVAGRF